MQSLHWLPIHSRIIFKILLLSTGGHWKFVGKGGGVPPGTPSPLGYACVQIGPDFESKGDWLISDQADPESDKTIVKKAWTH